MRIPYDLKTTKFGVVTNPSMQEARFWVDQTPQPKELGTRTSHSFGSLPTYANTNTEQPYFACTVARVEFFIMVHDDPSLWGGAQSVKRFGTPTPGHISLAFSTKFGMLTNSLGAVGFLNRQHPIKQMEWSPMQQNVFL